MIETIFNKEKEQIKHILNVRNIIQNISYKISNDLNSKYFFDNVINYIRNYDSLDRMIQYQFKRDLKEMREILNLLYAVLKNFEDTKNKAAEDIIKPRSIFPDNIGKRIISQISYIPILELFYKDLKYKEYIADKIDLQKKFCGDTPQENQRKKLFNRANPFNKKFPKDEDFIDYEMKNELIEIVEKEYEKEKEEIKNSLNILLLQYENSTDINKTLLLIGAAYWENEKKSESSQFEALKKSMEAISKAFNQNEAEKLNTLEILLSQQILEIITPIAIDSLKISINKNGGLIELKTKMPISEKQLENILKIFIIKTKKELLHIKLLEPSLDNQNFKFSCDIEVY